MNLEEYLNKYIEAFGEGFPMYQLGRGRTDEEIGQLIADCIANKKDAYAMGFVTDDVDVQY